MDLATGILGYGNDDNANGLNAVVEMMQMIN
jgi:hypothetical protein